MGTTAFLAMAATNPDMREKIIMANLLSPVAFMEHMKSPVRLFAPYAEDIEVDLYHKRYKYLVRQITKIMFNSSVKIKEILYIISADN